MSDKGRPLRVMLRRRGATEAFFGGRLAPAGCEFEFAEVARLPDGFRRMVRASEFDICEMAITTYLCARDHGKPVTALPVFPVRGFHHGAILVNRNAGILSPGDLEGRYVGVERGYTVTAGVWARAALREEYGVDLSRVTWVVSGDEHVAEYETPANVVRVREGASLGDLLISGDIVAAIGVEVRHPDVVPLFLDASKRGLERLVADGRHPINHLIVLRDEVLVDRPALAIDLFAAFCEAKRDYVARLTSGTIADPDAVDRVNFEVLGVQSDPLPYGIAPSRATLGTLLDHAVDQQIISAAPPVDALFAAGTRELMG